MRPTVLAPPLDFLAQIECQLGIDHDEALLVLEGWLLNYVPVARGTIELLTMPNTPLLQTKSECFLSA